MILSTITDWDEAVSAAVIAHRTEWGNALFTTITAGGNFSSVVIILAVLTAFLGMRRKLHYAVGIISSMLVSLGLLEIIKHIVCRVRPAVEQLVSAPGYSFPSMHTALSVVLYGWIGFIFLTEGWIPAKWAFPFKLLLTLPIVLIGFSRVYVNVHFFSDVCGGLLIGLLFLQVSVGIYRRVQWKENYR